MIAQVLGQQTDVPGFDVWMRCLPFPVREETGESIDLPLLPGGCEDILDVLPETQWNIRCRRCLNDRRW